jgi:hypothetical protein
MLLDDGRKDESGGTAGLVYTSGDLGNGLVRSADVSLNNHVVDILTLDIDASLAGHCCGQRGNSSGERLENINE